MKSPILNRAINVLINLDTSAFTFNDYAQLHPMHRSTAYRDWRRLIKQQLIKEIGCVSSDTRIPLYISTSGELNRKLYKA